MPAEALDLSELKPIDLSDLKPATPQQESIDLSELKPIDLSDLKPATTKPSDATIKAGPEPGFFERLKGMLVGSPRSGDTPIGRALGYTFEAPSENHVPTTSLPLARVSEIAPEITQAIGMAVPGGRALMSTPTGKGVGQGVADVAEGLTTAPNILMAAGSEGFGLLAQVNKFLPRAVSAGFSIDMLHQAYDQSPQVKQAWYSGDAKSTAEAITHLVATAGLGAMAGVHAVRGVQADISQSIEEHNTVAQRLIEQERNQPSANPEPAKFTLGSQSIPVKIGDRSLEIRPAGMSGSRRPFYDVVDTETGEVVKGGYGGDVQDYLRQRGAVANAPLPAEPAPIVQQAQVPPEQSPAGPGATTPAQSSPTGVPVQESAAAPLPPQQEGYTTKTGDIVVTKREDGRTYFVKTLPDGTVLPERHLFDGLFRNLVSGATPLSAGGQEQAISLDDLKPAEQTPPSSAPTELSDVKPAATAPPAPAASEAEQEVIQPTKAAAAPEVAGAPEEDPYIRDENGLPLMKKGSEDHADLEANAQPQSPQPVQLAGSSPEVPALSPRVDSGVSQPAGSEEPVLPEVSKANGDQAGKEEGVEAPGHKFSSTQVNLPEEFASKARAAAAKIPDSVLAEDGRENDPHITALYGLHDSEPAAVQKILADQGPLTAKVKGISIFPANEGQEARGGSQYDVVKLDVESPELAALNKKLSALPNSNTFPKYQPHITLAYVKPGEGKKFVGRPVPGLSGKTVTFNALTFSPAEGEKTNIPLSGKSVNGQAATSPKDAFRMKGPELKALAEKGDSGAQAEIDRRLVKSGKPAQYAKAETKAAPAETKAAVAETKAPEPPKLLQFPEAKMQQPLWDIPGAEGIIQEVAERLGEKPEIVRLMTPDEANKELHLEYPEELGGKSPQPISAKPAKEVESEPGEPHAIDLSELKPPEAIEPVRSSDSEPLGGQLPEGNQGAPASGATAPSGGNSSRTRRKSPRTGSGKGPELEPSGGTVSGVVGDAAEPERTFPPRAQDVVSTHHDRDYKIPDGRVVSGSPEARARTNIEAIRTLREIQQDERLATVEEQQILGSFVGWGAVPQLFSGKNAEFQALQDELKNLLTPEEYSDAQRSTTNAHYTGDLVVDSIWKAVQAMGAKPGMSWLEPAVGVGNFFGRQPQELLEGARRVGLDKDSISGQIAKLLYPDSGIEVEAFEDAELPKDYFDGAISNVPFGNFGVHDAAFKGKKFITGSIHNYFFAKALTHVRPGGVVAFVTSRYTMDAYSPDAVQFRKYIGEQAHLIGAVRLPSGTFRQNAGTDVITDVIFLRRRLPSEDKALGNSWANAPTKSVKRDNWGAYLIPVNEYFHNNPDMILGKESLSRGQFTDHDYDVAGNASAEQIADAVSNFPKIGFEDWKPGKKSRTVAIRELNAPAEQSKLGGLFFNDKGNLFRKTSKRAAEPIETADGVKSRIRGQLAIRDALIRLTQAELDGKPDPQLGHLRKLLNHAYDIYVKSNGPLSSQANTAAMKGDPDAPLLVSLERRFDKGNKAQGKFPSAEKAPIFERRMLKPPEVPTSVGDPKEALYISLNEKGRLDFERMGELTGRTPEQLQQDLSGLIYEDPSTKTWQTAEEYLSGSVRAKLKQARAIAKVEPKYKANVEALERSQPIDVAPGDIRALLGVTWVPIDRYSEFAADMLGAERPEAVKVKYAGGNWIVDTGYSRLNDSTKWSTARVPASELLTDSLNMRRTKVYDRDSDGTSTVNPTETQAARARQMEIQDHFEKWLFADTKRGDELVRTYNDTQNDLRLRTYDGSHLTLPGMTKDAAVVRGGDLEPHQKAAVWRGIVQPNVLLAHAVGSGKTFEAIAIGMELKRLGLIQRPMYVVPNATLTGWQNQFAALYPQKRILVFSEKDLERSKRQQLMAQIATGDWDAVVVPHSSFQFLPTGDAIFDEHFQKLSRELENAIQEATEAGLATQQIKRMEKAKERLLTNLKDKRAAESKDLTVTWEQLGIDQLFVDESQDYKKLGFATKQGNVAGIDQQGNQKTFDLLMKMRHTQRHGRGVVFMTGTPVTNTMGELYSIMKYLIDPEMDARGIWKFDEWAANFGRTVDVFEPKIEGGGYQMKARFSAFVNLPELAQLFRSFADVVTSDMVDLPRPEIIGGKRLAVETQLSDEQSDILEELRGRAKNIRQDPRGSLPDNMLAVYTDAQKMALDPRMVRPGAPDDPNGRLNEAANLIHQYWEDSKKEKGAQAVFSDLGKPAEAGGSKDFSVYDELIRKLVERGIPRDQIAHIYQAKNKTQRSKLFQDVNDGKVRVIMGSTMKMGVGTNIQDRLYALHHLDVPHRPSDLEQREGRILRQGNRNAAVHIRYYVTKGSLDEAKFANVVRKAKFINQVMQGKSEVREAEDVGGMVPSLEMFQAMASGDPRVMRKMEVDAEVDRLGSVFSGWKNQQYKIRTELQQIPGRIQWAQKAIQNIQRDIAVRDKAGEVWSIGKQKFAGEKISKDVTDAIRKQLPKILDSKSKDVEVGKAFGLPILVSAEMGGINVEIGDTSSFGLSVEEAASADLYRRIKNKVEDLGHEVSYKEHVIELANKEQGNLKKSIEENWPYAKQYQEMIAEQQKLIKELGADKGDDATAAVGEGGEIADKRVQAQEVEDSDEEEGPAEEESAAPGKSPILPRTTSGTEQPAPGVPAQSRKGERGSVPLDFLTLGIPKFVEKDIAPTLGNAVRAIGASRNDILRVIAPASRGPAAKETSLTIRERAAELARATDRAEAALNVARKYFETLPAQENLDFIDRIENGVGQPAGGLQMIASTMRTMLDDRRQQVQDLGTGKLQNFYENYFPHEWKDEGKAVDAFKSWFSKRPMEGAKSFLKKRTIPTIKDGIDMGLEPASTNPVDLILTKVREMDKYIFAHRALNDMKQQGLLKFVRAGHAPDQGYAKIEDKIATVFGPPTEEGAQTIRGQYYAPEEAATIINNYLSPGLRKYASFRAYMGLANMLNQFQLGWSAFHLGFTSMDAAVSRFAAGVYQAAHGEPLKGLATAASFPAAPFRGIMQGDKILKEWFKPGSQGQEISDLVDAMTMAGGRAQMDKFYGTQITKKMMEALRQGNILGAAIRLPFALTEQASRPIMEYIVPRQKMAVFADLARIELERLQEHGDAAKYREALARAWDSVDNRMGQLVYDNLFWNKAVKDLTMASVRSVGWNVGTIREIIGGGGDALKAAKDAIRRKKPDVTPRMTYLIALPIVAGLVGGVLHYLWTHGEHPKELKDYYFPRRGAPGTPEYKKRAALPSYVKDIVHYGRDPYRAIRGKVHPLLELMIEMLSNEDYFGHHIRNEHDPLVKQFKAAAKHVGEAIEPMAVRPMLNPDKRDKAQSPGEKLLPFIGVTPAPKYITDEAKPHH